MFTTMLNPCTAEQLFFALVGWPGSRPVDEQGHGKQHRANAGHPTQVLSGSAPQ
jgi:hypothetical protein